MNAILFKDLFHHRYLLLAGIVLILIASLLPSSVNPGILVGSYVSILLIVTVLGIFIVESIEEKNHGYVFYASLPVSKLGIMAAKFGMILIECGLLCLISWIVLELKGIAHLIPVPVSSIFAFSFTGALVLNGLLFWGIYVFGLQNFTKGMIALALLIQAYFFVLSLDSYTGGDSVQQLAVKLGVILSASPFLVISFGLLLWSVILISTAQFQKRI